MVKEAYKCCALSLPPHSQKKKKKKTKSGCAYVKALHYPLDVYVLKKI